jgi:hypothetical protein
VNLSAVTIADVPPRVVTLTATVPEPFGDLTVISVSETILVMVALACPK